MIELQQRSLQVDFKIRKLLLHIITIVLSQPYTRKMIFQNSCANINFGELYLYQSSKAEFYDY